jgi:hypothetical protein
MMKLAKKQTRSSLDFSFNNGLDEDVQDDVQAIVEQEREKNLFKY